MDGNTARLSLGLDAYYAYFRSRTYDTPKGTQYPLLLNDQPFVGDTYKIDPGDWLVGAFSVEVVPFIGPARASFVSGGSLEKALAMPPLVDLELGYTYVHCAATTWTSDSPQWDWTHEELWLEGDKNQLRANLTVSLLRLGLPLQLYGAYRNQSLIPGKYTRAADTWNGGARLLAKFW